MGVPRLSEAGLIQLTHAQLVKTPSSGYVCERL